MSDTYKKIGLYGGTFDPVHIGHLLIAASVLESKQLDRIIFIPSARPPHKSSDIMFGADARLRMLEKAVDGDSRFAVSDIELKRDGFSYTIDTIREMKKEYSDLTELFFIVGMDNLYEIEMWKNPRDIIKESKVLAANRICDESRPLPPWVVDNVEIVDVPLIEISSSDIRKRIHEGRSIKYLVPDAVYSELK